MSPPRLVLLTDRRQLPPGRDLVDTVRRCVEVGLRLVIVREHDLEPGVRSDLVARLVALPGLRVVPSRIAEPAADGLHLAADQPRDPAVPGLVGRSCHRPEEVARSADEGVDYVTLSPYAASRSKPGHGPPLPATAFAGHPIPVLALGGVDEGNASAAVLSGAHGVAVMGAVMRADDPAAVVSALLAATRGRSAG